MTLKVGNRYKIKIHPDNFLVEDYVDENYAIVHFADCPIFKLGQVGMFEDLNGKTCKYLGPPHLPPSTDLVLIEVETKFGNVRMILSDAELAPLVVVSSSSAPICVCATQVIMSAGCQCGSFQKEQALKASLTGKK